MPTLSINNLTNKPIPNCLSLSILSHVKLKKEKLEEKIGGEKRKKEKKG